MRTSLVVLSVVIFLLANPASGEDETEYFAVFIEGQKAGHGIHERKVAEGKVSTTETVNLIMNRAGVFVTVKTVETSVETTSGEALGFETTQDLAAMTVNIKGTLNKQGQIELTTTSAGGVQKNTLPWPSGALMAEGVRLLELKKGLAEGTTFTTKVFVPSMLSAFDAEIRVGPKRSVDLLGRVVALTEVTTIIKSGFGEITSTSFVDENLKAQKVIVPAAGITVEMVACAKEFALSDNNPVDLIEKLFVPSPVSLADAESAKSITYHLVPTGEEKLRIVSNDNQTVQPDGKGGLIVTVQPASAPAGVSFPYKGKDKRALEAMRPTRFLQSENKEIIALAREAVGETKDAAEAVKRIEKFVGRYIDEKNLSVGYASAAEIAQSKQGDCSEHAVLTAAMCRSVGIPAEVAMGMLYVSEFVGRENLFAGHAWAQAFVAGKWIGLDATGRGPRGFTNTHITLGAGSGSPEDFFELVTTIGNFRIDKVTVDK